MNADADIHVWLETIAKAQTSIIIPHVNSHVEQQIRYRITTTQVSQAGRSSIGQSDSVMLQHDVSTPLSQLAIRRSPTDTCRIELILYGNWQHAKEKCYIFQCPDPAEGQ